MATDSPWHQRHPNRSDALPEPEPELLMQSAELVALIANRIGECEGRLPFDHFMELALYAPRLGYYSAGLRKFGEQGDFITAPEASNLFARCIARQCLQVLREIGGGDLLEFGAGSGVLAADLLQELDALGSLPERYLIVELSAELKARQRALLQQRLPQLLHRITWLDGFPEHDFQGVVIANEVLDAMPVHRFRVDQCQILEQYVKLNHGRLCTAWEEPSDELRGAVERLAERLGGLAYDYESEINLRAVPWLQELATRLSRGLILLIDYGYNRAEFFHPQRDRGTLMCHYRHRAHMDPLFHPGVQDITAQVEFTSLAEAALEAGLVVSGYTTQAFF